MPAGQVVLLSAAPPNRVQGARAPVGGAAQAQADWAAAAQADWAPAVQAAWALGAPSTLRHPQSPPRRHHTQQAPQNLPASSSSPGMLGVSPCKLRLRHHSAAAWNYS